MIGWRSDGLLISLGVVCSGIIERLILSDSIFKAQFVGLVVIGTTTTEYIIKVLIVRYLSRHVACQLIQQAFDLLGGLVVLGHVAKHRVVVRLLELALPLGKLVLPGEVLARSWSFTRNGLLTHVHEEGVRAALISYLAMDGGMRHLIVDILCTFLTIQD